MWSLYEYRLMPTTCPKMRLYLWVENGIIRYQRVTAPLGWIPPTFTDLTGSSTKGIRGCGFKKVRRHKMTQEQLAKGWLLL